jgi:hypothetical protein
MGREVPRDRPANPTAATGNHGHSAVESELSLIVCLTIQRETPRFQGMKSF